jgi:outer membrane lipoprotein SlyB
MKMQSIILALLATGLTNAYATSNADHGSGENRQGTVPSNEGHYGVIASIESDPAGNGVIGGTVIGGVLGGVVGHQARSNCGDQVTSVAGAAGAARHGAETGTENPQPDGYFIRVRFDDRGYQTVTQTSLDGLRVGDSVRIEHERVRRCR